MQGFSTCGKMQEPGLTETPLMCTSPIWVSILWIFLIKKLLIYFLPCFAQAFSVLEVRGYSASVQGVSLRDFAC